MVDYSEDFLQKLVNVNFGTKGKPSLRFTNFGVQSGRPYRIVITISQENNFDPFIADSFLPQSDWVAGSPFNPFLHTTDKKFDLELPTVATMKKMLQEPGERFFLAVYYIATDIPVGGTWSIAYLQKNTSGKIIKTVPGGGTDQDWPGTDNKLKLVKAKGVVEVKSSTGAGKWVGG